MFAERNEQNQNVPAPNILERISSCSRQDVLTEGRILTLCFQILKYFLSETMPTALESMPGSSESIIDSKYIKPLHTQISVLREMLVEVIEEIKSLKKEIKHENVYDMDRFLKKFAFLRFPITEEEDLQNLENILVDEENFCNGVCEMF